MKRKDKPMKSILFIAATLSSGGAERVISELANYYADNGIEVYIMLVANDTICYDINRKVHIIPINNEISNKSGLSAMLSRLKLIKKHADQICPTIIISFLSVINIYSCLALGLSKYKLIVSERGYPKTDPKSLIKKLMRRFAYLFADGFVFQTQQAKEYFSKRIQKKSIIIPNPIKKDLPQPYDGIRNKKIVAVGRLETQKNYPLLFEAFKEFSKTYDDYKLIVYGDGSKKTQLEELIINLNLENKITLMGVVQNFHSDIKDAAMYILSSDYEGMPNALMEAMAIGLPSISTNCPCGGPAYLIKHRKNGLLFEVGDKDTLVKHMELIVKDHELSKKISEKAHTDLKKLKIDIIAKKWLNYIESIIIKRGGKHKNLSGSE